MAKKTILLYKEFGDNIFTRQRIASFFDKIENFKEKEIIIDFKKIEFISRSCADEYLKRKEESDKILTERNMPQQVCTMFKVVVNQLKEADFSFSSCNPQKLITCPA